MTRARDRSASLIAFLLTAWLTACSSVDGRTVEPATEVDSRFSREELLADVDHLFATIHAVHPNPYHRVDSTVVAEARQQVIDALSDSMDALQFWRLAAPLVAQLRDGHTSMSVPRAQLERHMGDGHRLFPFTLHVDSAGVSISADLSDEQPFAVGSRVHHINGRPVNELIDEATATLSFERDALRVRVFERAVAEIMPLVWGWNGPFALDVELPSGERVAETVAGITVESWRSRVEAAGPRTGPVEPYTYSAVADGALGHIDFRAHLDAARFERFLKDTFAQLREQRPCALVIDLRRNGGGSAELGDQLMRYLTDRPVRQYSRVDVRASGQVKTEHRHRIPRPVRWLPGAALGLFDPRFGALLTAQDGAIISWSEPEKQPKPNPLRWQGPVFVLTGVTTFSSAADLAAALQDYRIATVVGQETGGLASSYGEYVPSTLPHTQLRFNVSFKYFVRPSGVEGDRGVIPDVHVPEVRGHTRENDPELARVLQLLDPSCSRNGNDSWQRLRGG